MHIVEPERIGRGLAIDDGDGGGDADICEINAPDEIGQIFVGDEDVRCCFKRGADALLGAFDFQSSRDYAADFADCRPTRGEGFILPSHRDLGESFEMNRLGIRIAREP